MFAFAKRVHAKVNQWRPRKQQLSSEQRSLLREPSQPSFIFSCYFLMGRILRSTFMQRRPMPKRRQAPHRVQNSVNGFTLDLTDPQLATVKVEPVVEHEFPVEKEAVGSIDFNEDMETQVFTPYQGKIIALFAAVGDDAKKGQTLFTIDSPDLLQAESNLIAAVGVMDLTTRNLARLRELYKTSCRIAARSRAGDFRPANRRRHSARGA